MAVVRELLNLERFAPVRPLLRSCVMAESPNEPVVRSHVAARVHSLSAMLRRSIDKGAIVKVYADHAAIRGLCVLEHDGNRRPLRESELPDASGRSDIPAVGVSTGSSFSISALLAVGSDEEQVRIKTDLVQDILTEISGFDARVAARLRSSDRSGISALKLAGFSEETPSLTSAEQAWQEVLKSAGCAFANLVPGSKNQEPGTRNHLRQPRSTIVTLVRQLSTAKGTSCRIVSPIRKTCSPRK